MNDSNPVALHRGVGLFGAVMMGLGSIVGTGVFVSLGLAADIAGLYLLPALLLAGILAICNGLSSAQLAAAHPVSGGTYEYGYKYLHPWLGFFAGWLFVLAKSASAATAALGFAGYFANLWPWMANPQGLALSALIAITLATLVGIKRSSLANIVIVSVTLISLSAFIVFVGADFNPDYLKFTDGGLSDALSLRGFLEASALLFVAYTGYGRVATLGAEIENPKRNIPKAIIATLGVSFCLYLGVAVVALGAVGADVFAELTLGSRAPLEQIAELMGRAQVAHVLALGAMTAMLGVLLNLVLGISRVVYAMGAKGDAPRALASVNAKSRVPALAVIITASIIGALVLVNDIKVTWSFSAFTVLFYYALTNASALMLPMKDRLYPRVLSWAGLFGCLGLSFWVDAMALSWGLGLIAAGVLWRVVFRRGLS